MTTSNQQRRDFTRQAIAILTAAALPGMVRAQGNDKPLRVILPIGAGSGVDTAMRPMAAALGTALGRPIMIENLPGAGGITGTHQVVKAPKDGNTIGVVSINHVVNPSVYKSMPFDSLKDITPVMVVGALPFVLVVHPQVPAKNVQELIALAKAKPGEINYASSGNGTVIQLAAEMLASEAKIDIRHVPYRSTGAMVTDIIAGQVQMGFVAISVALPLIKSGTLRALGVTTKVRSPLAPNLPTLAEHGLPHYALDGWFAVIAPSGLPAAEVGKINSGFKKALATPEVSAALLAQGYILEAGSPSEAARHFAAETERLGRLAHAAGLKVD